MIVALAPAPLLWALLALVAFLYGSVGHGGASGYLAVLALAGAEPASIRPTALLLNVVVSAAALVRFGGAGHFRWRLFWPFAATAVPCAFLAGWRWTLSDDAYRLVLAGVLLLAAWRLLLRAPEPEGSLRRPVLPLALACGAAIGLLSGLVGVGGGIFLSPILLLARWATARQTAAVSSAFILAGSLAGLAGLGARGDGLAVDWPQTAGYAVAALAGGAVGASLGASRFAPALLRRLLALVLLLAAAKLAIPSVP